MNVIANTEISVKDNALYDLLQSYYMDSKASTPEDLYWISKIMSATYGVTSGVYSVHFIEIKSNKEILPNLFLFDFNNQTKEDFLNILNSLYQKDKVLLSIQKEALNLLASSVTVLNNGIPLNAITPDLAYMVFGCSFYITLLAQYGGRPRG